MFVLVHRFDFRALACGSEMNLVVWVWHVLVRLSALTLVIHLMIFTPEILSN